MSFGERLRELRDNSNITVRKLAKDLSVASSTISNYEQGIRHPDFNMLTKIAEYFDVSLDYLLGRTIDPNGRVELPKIVHRMRQEMGKSKEEFAEIFGFTLPELEMIEEGALENQSHFKTWLSLVVGGYNQRASGRNESDFREVPVISKIKAESKAPFEGEILGMTYDPTGNADYALEFSGDSMAPIIKDRERIFVRQQNTAENGQMIVAFIRNDNCVVRWLKKYRDVVVLKAENPKFEETVLDLRDDYSWGIIGVVLGKFQSFEVY